MKYFSVVAAVVALAATAQAQTKISRDSGSWSEPTNWTPAGAPGADDNVNIEGGFSSTYNSGSSASFSRINVGGTTSTSTSANGALSITGGSLTVNANAAGAYTVGGRANSTAVLNVSGGVMRTTAIGGGGLLVGGGAGSNGTVNISSGAAAISGAVSLGLGAGSTGKMVVSGGNVVAGTGTNNAGGVPTNTFFVGGRSAGDATTGKFEQKGGSVTIGGDNYMGIGHSSASTQSITGTASITGGSFYGNVRVGRDSSVTSNGGSGTLFIGSAADITGGTQTWQVSATGKIIFKLGTDDTFNAVDLTAAAGAALDFTQSRAKITIYGSNLIFSENYQPITLISFLSGHGPAHVDNVTFDYVGFDPQFIPKLVWTGTSLQLNLDVNPDPPADWWPVRREKIKRAWLDLLGDFPTSVPALTPIVKKVTFGPGCPSERLTTQQRQVLSQQIAEETGSPIDRYHVSFQTETNDRVTGWLLVPQNAIKPAPAMICIHSTTKGSGKDQTVGLSGSTPTAPPDTTEGGRSYGLHLARYGYITLSIDLLTDGERVEPGGRVMNTQLFYQSHPDWSIVGKNTWDIMRSVDFLQSLTYVDPKHIGCIGLSLGGHTSVFAGAFEPRLAATINVGGVLDWHRPTDTWARNAGYTYIKKFRPYVDNPTLPVPTDFDELMMLVAPRPLLILSSEWEFYNRRSLLDKCLSVARIYRDWRDDRRLPSVFEARRDRQSYQKTLSYYNERYNISPAQMEIDLRTIGAGDCFGWFAYPGGHSYPPVVRQYSCAWLDRWLDRVNGWSGVYHRPTGPESD